MRGSGVCSGLPIQTGEARCSISPPGGPTDPVGRALGNKLAEVLGQPIVLDFRGGAAGTIGTEHVAKSAPDRLYPAAYHELVCYGTGHARKAIVRSTQRLHTDRPDQLGMFAAGGESHGAGEIDQRPCEPCAAKPRKAYIWFVGDGRPTAPLR